MLSVSTSCRILEIRVGRCVVPLFVLAVGAGVGALMPMRMLRPPLVFVCVGDALLSLFRATGEFMFAGSWRLRLRRRSRPVSVGDVLSRDGVGFEGRGIRNRQHAVVGGYFRHHMRPMRS